MVWTTLLCSRNTRQKYQRVFRRRLRPRPRIQYTMIQIQECQDEYFFFYCAACYHLGTEYLVFGGNISVSMDRTKGRAEVFRLIVRIWKLVELNIREWIGYFPHIFHSGNSGINLSPFIIGDGKFAELPNTCIFFWCSKRIPRSLQVFSETPKDCRTTLLSYPFPKTPFSRQKMNEPLLFLCVRHPKKSPKTQIVVTAICIPPQPPSFKDRGCN